MKNLIIVFCISSFLATSCFEDPIELDLNEDNAQLVVEAWITNLDEQQYVSLSQTANYLGDDINPTISNAIVSLTDESGRTYDLQESEPGKYLLAEDWEPVLGDEYILTIQTNGQEYTATHVMRPSPPIEDLVIEPVLNDEDSLMGYETVFGLQEIPGKGDAYYVIDYLKESLYGDTLLNGGYADDEFFDGEFIEDIRVSEEDRLFQVGDVAVVEVFSIGRETARFLLDVELEVFRGGPFDPPPANVRTNIKGENVVGYFIMSGADRQEILIE